MSDLVVHLEQRLKRNSLLSVRFSWRTGLGVLFGLELLYWGVGHIFPSPEFFNEPNHTLTFLDALYLKNDGNWVIIKDRLEFPVILTDNLRLSGERQGIALSLPEQCLNHYPSGGILTGFTEYLHVTR